MSAFLGAATARQELRDLVQYCIAIVKTVLGTAKAKTLPKRIRHALVDLRRHIDSVTELLHMLYSKSGRSNRLCRLLLTVRDRATIQSCLHQLENDLGIITAATAIQIAEDVASVRQAVTRPSAPDRAAIPVGAPEIPSNYEERISSLVSTLVDRLTSTRASSVPTVFLGLGGGGRTALASTIVRDTRIRPL